MEQLANPSKDEGEWIAKIDLVESGTKLKLVEQASVPNGILAWASSMDKARSK